MNKLLDALGPTDVVLAIMGPIAVDRTAFMDVLAQQSDIQTRHEPTSHANDVRVMTLEGCDGHKTITLISTPGYGDAGLSDLKALETVSRWSEKLYRRNVKLTGILYMHRISDIKMDESHHKNLRMFYAVCGGRAMNRVVLVTTRWGGVTQQEGQWRKEELKRRFWKNMLENGAQTARFLGSFESAKGIVDELIVRQTGRETLLLQEELVDLNIPLNETYAGQTLHTILKQLANEQEETTKRLTAQINTQASPHITKALQKERESVGKALRGTLDDIRRLTAPPRRKLTDRIWGRTGRQEGIQQPKQYTEEEQSRLYPLMQALVRDRRQKALITALTGDDAQHMVDYFNLVLHEATALVNDQARCILSLLCKLAKSAGVYPRRCLLKGIACDPDPVTGGGFADVYKGEYEQQTICLKVIRIYQKKDNTKLLRTWVKEIVLWGHLSHPNILPFYGVYLLERPVQRLCIVSPWMEKGNLHAYLGDHPEVPPMPLLLDVIDGLVYLHQWGVVHGDLKGVNVLVSDDGRALIADFGLSYVATNTGFTSSGAGNGTTHWMAPELVAENQDLIRPTKESDIWSFGCLCYEVLARKTPFHQYGNKQVVLILMKGEEIPVRPLEGHTIDDEMWDVMMKCWNYTPRDRPTCEAVQQFIAGFQGGDHRHKVSSQQWDTFAFRKAVREKSGARVDFKRVEEILLQVQMEASTAAN